MNTIYPLVVPMNFLAHTFLSCKDPNLLVGNFMADFIGNKDKQGLKLEILQGIELHKKIDHFTDHHPSVKEAVRVIRKSQGKYAPVTIDILFDYILTQDWHMYAISDLKEFTLSAYETLHSHLEHYPSTLKELLPRMIADDFLMSCATEERLVTTFQRVKRRAKFDNNFEGGHQVLFEHYDVLNNHFHQFFPDLIQEVNMFCDCN